MPKVAARQGFSAILLLVIGFVVIFLAGSFIIGNRQTKVVKVVNPITTLTQNIAAPTIKTYSNKDLSIEFQYQPNLQVKEDSEAEFNQRSVGLTTKSAIGDLRKNFTNYLQYEPGKFLGAVVVLDETGSYDKNPLTIWVFDNPNDLSIDTWYKNYWYFPFVWGDFTYDGKLKISPQNEATISGQIAKFGTVDYQPGSPKFIYLSRGGKMYLFRVIGNIGDQILATFKLTN